MTSAEKHQPRPVPHPSDRARLALRVANPTPVEPAYRRLVRFAGWLLRLMVDRDWDDAANLPSTGPVIVVSNHISYFDPPNLAHYLVWSGRWPRALGKADFWRVPILGWLARATGQIPVERGTERAKDALVHAREALNRGECVVIYPEGTVTADPEVWPMTPRPGAARLALATGVPVVPVGQWGAHLVMPGKRPGWPKLRPRRTVSFRCGAPVELSDLYGRTDSEAEVVASARIMASLTELVIQLRGEPAPVDVYDIRVGRRVPRLDAR